MASYMALKEGWLDSNGKPEPIDFKVLDTFAELRNGTNDGRTAAFMWEKYTTKPFTEAGTGECKFLDFVPTPWASWMIVAKPEVAKAQLKGLLERLTVEVHKFNSAEGRQESSRAFVEKQFGYPREDVEAWLAQVDYPKVGLEVVERGTIENTLR